MYKFFDLKVGWSCNNACMHCAIDDKKNTCGDTSFEDLKKIIDDNNRYDIFVVTGGEPTIREDFLDIIKYIKSLGKRIILQTNGRRFKDFEFAKETLDNIDEVLIAIHSYSPAIHDLTTQRPGSWEETVLGIMNLYNLLRDTGANKKLSLQYILNVFNSVDLIKSYDFMQEIAPGCVMDLTHPHPHGASRKNFFLSVPKFSTIKKEIHDVVSKYGKLIHIEGIPKCYLHPYVRNVGAISWYDNSSTKMERGGYDPSNTSNTTLKNCGEEIGFDDKGITRTYHDLILTEIMKAPKCVECIYDKECVGVWKEYILRYQGELDLFPITEENKDAITR